MAEHTVLDRIEAKLVALLQQPFFFRSSSHGAANSIEEHPIAAAANDVRRLANTSNLFPASEMVIPVFDGKIDAYWWVLCTEKYFKRCGTLEAEKMSVAAIAMAGHARTWWLQWYPHHRWVSWDWFTTAFLWQFKPEYRNILPLYDEEGEPYWISDQLMETGDTVVDGSPNVSAEISISDFGGMQNEEHNPSENEFDGRPDDEEELIQESSPLKAHSDSLITDLTLIDAGHSKSALGDMEMNAENPNEAGLGTRSDEKLQCGSDDTGSWSITIPANSVPLSKPESNRPLHTAARECQHTGGSVIPPPPPKPPDDKPHGGDRVPFPTESTRASTAVNASIPDTGFYDPCPPQEDLKKKAGADWDEIINSFMGVVIKTNMWEVLVAILFPICFRSIYFSMGMRPNDAFEFYEWSSKSILHGLHDLMERDEKDKANKIGIKPYSRDEFLYMGKENPSSISPPLAHDIWTLIPTSGTCGDPKGVVILHENIVALVNGLLFFLEQFKDTRIVEKFLGVICCVVVCQGYGLTKIIGSTTLGFPDEMCLVGIVGDWSWKADIGEEFHVGIGLAKAHPIPWCAVEYFESNGVMLHMLLCHLSPNSLHNRKTLLHHAIVCSNATSVTILLTSGVGNILHCLINSSSNLDSHTKSRLPALMFCTRHNCCIRVLISARFYMGVVNSSAHCATTIKDDCNGSLRFTLDLDQSPRSAVFQVQSYLYAKNEDVAIVTRLKMNCIEEDLESDQDALDFIVAIGTYTENTWAVELLLEYDFEDQIDMEVIVGSLYLKTAEQIVEGIPNVITVQLDEIDNASLYKWQEMNPIFALQTYKGVLVIDATMVAQAVWPLNSFAVAYMHCSNRFGDFLVVTLFIIKEYVVHVHDTKAYTPLMLTAREDHWAVGAFLFSGHICLFQTMGSGWIFSCPFGSS